MKVYREVLCPDCGKKYMTFFYDDGYDVMIKQGEGYLQGWKDSCPKCDNDLFVEDKVLEGKSMDEFPDNTIHQKFILR